jgi:hypothetical protein
MCICRIPGRSDHRAMLGVFFGDPEPEPAWEAGRQIRVRSLGLHLAYHHRRPPSQPGSLSDFRAAIAGRSFANGSPLEFAHGETLSAWRAYQLRECETLVFTAVWSWYLQRLLEEVHPMTHAVLRDLLVDETIWSEVNLETATPLREAKDRLRTLIPDGSALVRWVEPLGGPASDKVGTWLARALMAVLAIDEEANEDDQTVRDLRNDGGPHRWSINRLSQWLALRADESISSV